jgi:hypothetical protein
MLSQTLNQKLRLMIAVLWTVLWTGFTMIICFGAWPIQSSMIHERHAVVEESIYIVKHYYALFRQGGLLEDDAPEAGARYALGGPLRS